MTALDRPTKSGRPEADDAHIVILLATRDGAKVLPDQLASLVDQTHKNWSLLVSDDGSKDETRAIVRRFARDHPGIRVTLLRGPQKGSAQNFLSLLRAAGRARFVAFCDQDDVWFPDKLARGLDSFRAKTGPAIYGSRTTIADESLRPLRPSPQFRRKPAFENALVQNVAGGNTMILNRAALDVLQPASLKATHVVAHDWWCYQMVTGCGGELMLDQTPSLLYRQHDANQIGANSGLVARAARVRSLAQGEFADWMDGNIDALDGARNALTPEAQRQLDVIKKARRASLFARLLRLWRAGVHRQTVLGSLAFWLAAILGRV